ncbi:MAG: Gfo/Idh/MocA family oxidoreductase [Pseudomonadota bacterium]
MKIGIVGCGYVFDLYMATMARHPILEIAGVHDINPARVAAVTRHYGLKAYAGLDAMLADEEIGIVVVLTGPGAHFAVSKAALEAGKHVYCEKPLTPTLEEADALFAIAEARGLHVSCAPSNVLGHSVQTLWKAVQDGTVGKPRLVYAEFDDNPVYLMRPDTWVSASGAPWPYVHEYETGCTYEHAGYHLSWMCAIFGPVRSLTAFSSVTVPDKTDLAMSPADTPDFSVACLEFDGGVVGRLTCSIAAPLDHRMRVIGNEGVLEVDSYRDDEAPVYLERFNSMSLRARNYRAIRNSSVLRRAMGIGGRRLPLTRVPPPGRDDLPAKDDGRWWHPATLKKRFRRWQTGLQDKSLGIAELAAAVGEGRAPYPSHTFTRHLTEITIAIQSSGTRSSHSTLESTFKALSLNEKTVAYGQDYRRFVRSGAMSPAIR